MKTLLPSALPPLLALGAAALLLAPARDLSAFTTLGGDLAVNERDVRLFDNFADATANDNVVPAPQFPGWLGAELAVWKGVVEWGSQAHGNGSGDTTQAVLGSGGANFDAFWAGSASEPGTVDANIVSKINSCSSGVLAYCEASFNTGWRIRFCESWVWNDGPGSISSGQFDLQGVMTHEYGHALGLGHSAASDATMYPSVGSGVTATRSIEADDIAGVKAIYGVRAAGKPTISATVAQGGTLVIHGTNFSATNNQVWFPLTGASDSFTDPRLIVAGLSSNGTRLTLAIPAGAAPGDVLVKAGFSGHASLSNAFPTDLVGTFGNPPVIQPDLTSVVPSTIEALIPGTAQTITLNGTDLDLVSAVLLDGVPIAPARYTLVDASTITLDMPQVATLGTHTLGVSAGGPADQLVVTLVAPAVPRYELADGAVLEIVDRDGGLRLRLAGPVGAQLGIYVSGSNAPSQNAFVQLEIGNQFSELLSGGRYTVPAAGWLQIDVPTAALPDPGAGSLVLYSQLVRLAFPAPFADSNLQSMILVQ